VKAAVVGLAGLELTAREARALEAAGPAGVILFRRNIEEPGQLARLIASLRSILPAEAVLMVDQEGGRVARLRPPHWLAHPPPRAIGAAFARDPARGRRAALTQGTLIGLEARAAGFDVVTAPVLDLAVPGQSDVVGDRAFSTEPAAVAALGRWLAAGLLRAGVQPVMKHMPGHGRALVDSHLVDSHLALPRVEAADLTADLAPFIANADLPWGVTAHVLFAALDPTMPATLSSRVIGEVIRGRIGFRGVLVSDDLAMGALSGPPEARAAAALAAGCDVALYCSGVIEETKAVLAACPPLPDTALGRLAAARAMAARARRAAGRSARTIDILRARRDRLLA
jgi:beta-N-acetylhexosaminidase